MRFIIKTALLLVGPLGLGLALANSSGPRELDESSCYDCHRAPSPDKTTHFITSVGDCRFCHEVQDPAGAHIAETVEGNVACLSCHSEHDPSLQETSDHTALGCTSCHNPHGSENPSMLVEPVVTLCSESCHTDGQLGLSHPVGPGVADMTTGGEMTCVSTCHSVHNPTEPKLLQLASLDLCNQCHGEMF